MEFTLLSGIVGALTVFLLTTVYNYFRDIRDKRFQCRSFVVTEQIYNLGTMLEGYDYESSEDIRLVQTESLERLDEDIRTGALSNEKVCFLKVENLGPFIVTNVNIRMQIEEKVSKKKVILQKTIPIITLKQKIFILVHDMAFYYEPQHLVKTTITYNTIAGEQIKYSRELSESTESLMFEEKYSYKRFGVFKQISSVEVEPVSWIFIRHKR